MEAFMIKKHYKLIIFLLIIFVIFLIYKANHHNYFNYTSLGDGYALGISSYGEEDYGEHVVLYKILEDVFRDYVYKLLAERYPFGSCQMLGAVGLVYQRRTHARFNCIYKGQSYECGDQCSDDIESQCLCGYSTESSGLSNACHSHDHGRNYYRHDNHLQQSDENIACPADIFYIFMEEYSEYHSQCEGYEYLYR